MTMPLNQLKNDLPTIAILTNAIGTPFAEGITLGAIDYAKEHNYNVLSFTGVKLGLEYRTRIFELIDMDLIDGVIIPMGSLSRFISAEEKHLFLKKFEKVLLLQSQVISQVTWMLDIAPEKVCSNSLITL